MLDVATSHLGGFDLLGPPPSWSLLLLLAGESLAGAPVVFVRAGARSLSVRLGGRVRVAAYSYIKLMLAIS